MIAATLHELPEEKRLIIRNATQRINDIANGLLQKARCTNLSSGDSTSSVMPSTPHEPVLLMALLDSIMSEKRLQYRERMEVKLVEDLTEGYGLFVNISSTELARAVSNLVNNAVEAIRGPGAVTVSLQRKETSVEVVVKDTGVGMGLELVRQLGQRGFTYGKEELGSGSGLGIYHARKLMEENGGSFFVESRLGEGTSVTMSLPCSTQPKWFVKRISLRPPCTVVSVDDDQTIHQIWAERLSRLQDKSASQNHIAFSSLDQFEKWLQTINPNNFLFLVDFEFLGQEGNGLDMIERMGIGRNAVLVTSRYEEPEIRERAKKLGLRVLPKSLAPFVPITLADKSDSFDAIVVDDDPLVHMTWKLAAGEQEKRVACFSTPSEFFEKIRDVDVSTPLFIDVDLGNCRGEEVAIKASKLGFQNIALATGHHSSSICVPSCVSRVLGKEPQF